VSSQARAALLIGLGWAVPTFGAPGASAQEQGGNERYCLSEKPTVLFLVDVTTEYDPRSKALLGDAAQRILGSLTGGERLVIRTITESFASSDRLYSGCVPVCSDGRMFFGCSEAVARYERRGFLLHATEALRRRLQEFRSGQRSDIIRTLVSVAREDGRRTPGPQTLYIFSDLIENSDHLPGSALFKRRNAVLLSGLAGSGLIPNLSGSMVKVFGVGRAGTEGYPPLSVEKLAKLLSFWRSYFEAGRAGGVEITEGLPSAADAP
jgi:hypothetical protein